MWVFCVFCYRDNSFQVLIENNLEHLLFFRKKAYVLIMLWNILSETTPHTFLFSRWKVFSIFPCLPVMNLWIYFYLDLLFICLNFLLFLNNMPDFLHFSFMCKLLQQGPLIYHHLEVKQLRSCTVYPIILCWLYLLDSSSMLQLFLSVWALTSSTVSVQLKIKWSRCLAYSDLQNIVRGALQK